MTQHPPELTDPATPAEVVISSAARPAVTDASLGVEVHVALEGVPRHRLVTIGDSLTQGFQSGAIYNTDISYPALIADRLGGLSDFRFPRYEGYGGIGVNVEMLIRELEARCGDRISWYELPEALDHARRWLREAETYWEQGEGAQIPRIEAINHNLAVYGWDLRDALDRTFDVCYAQMKAPKKHFIPNVGNANNLAALRVLPSGDELQRGMTVFEAAAELGAEGSLESPGQGDGIETLIVLLGANNALSAVTTFEVKWSEVGYDDLEKKDAFNVWRPSHFAAEFDLVAAQVEKIRARHVIFGTVPHVTVIPLAHGVGKDKQYPGSRYFPYYTWPWIDDGDFHPKSDPHLTHQQARAIDSAIDMYNDHIAGRVTQARKAGLDWYLLDLAGMLDRLAFRRYMKDPAARPSWWSPYQMPAELAAFDVDSRFFESDETGLLQGGLFALDGVHPTTVGYGLVAQEFINVMRLAEVRFPRLDSRDLPRVDWARIIERDSLISAPPASLRNDLRTVAWLDEAFEIFQRITGRARAAG